MNTSSVGERQQSRSPRIDAVEAATELKARRQARAFLLPFAQYTFLGYKMAPHLEKLAQALEALERREITRLAVFMPPRHGKSELASIRFPAWYLGRNPQHQVIGCSYAESLAYSNSWAVLRLMHDDAYQALWPVKFATESATKWQLAGKDNNRASYLAAGVGGGITGEGADCLPAGTLISTNAGLLPIEQLQYAPLTCKILSYDTDTRTLQYQATEAFSIRPKSWLFRITTASGRVVEATGNHRIWTATGYKRACELTPGDSLVCLVQKGISAPSIRNTEVSYEGLRADILLCQMQECARGNQESSAMCEVRHTRSQKHESLLREVSPASVGAQGNSSAGDDPLSDVQCHIPCHVARQGRGQVCSILQQTLCGARALTVDGGQTQPEVEERRDAFTQRFSLCKGFSRYETLDPAERQQYVSSVPVQAETARTSSGQLADEQRSIKPSDSLLFMPPTSAQGVRSEAVTDTVAVVEQLCGTAPVYDLQVAVNHNFFANGVLVHNCLIIDDPIKSQEEADSQVYRDKTWQWYRSVARTRLQPNGVIILILTRWHVDDLAGRLLSESKIDPKADQWTVLHLPALTDGQALWSEQYPADALESIRATIGSRSFEALYQGSPTLAEGNLIKREWWQYYKVRPVKVRIIQSWDTAFKDKSQNDYSVCTTWGIAQNAYYLLDVARHKLEFPELKRMCMTAYERDKPERVYIEDKASGQSLIQELKRETRIPLFPVKVDSDKVARANAITPLIESGRVYLPQYASWLHDYLEELSAFPNDEHDDQVDSTTQALSQMANPVSYGFGFIGEKETEWDLATA